MRWSSNSLGSKLQHLFFYYLSKYGGARVARCFLQVVVLYYTMLPSVRKRCQPYLQRRFPAAKHLKRFVHAYRLYLAFGTILLDRTIAKATGHFSLHRTAHVLAAIEDVLQQGHGCILLSAHIGAWQLGLAGLETLPCPIHMLQYRASHDVDTHYFEHGQGRSVGIIDAGGSFGGLVESSAALKRNEVVCIMGDRILGAEQVCTLPFLGGMASFPTTTYALASITQAPIVISITLHEHGVARGVLGGVMPVPQHLSRKNPSVFLPYVTEFSNFLDRQTQEHPYQFFNFYNMWVTTHDERATHSKH